MLMLAIGLAGVIGCSKTYLPFTRISETEETRAVYDMVMSYRAAIEKRDMAGILAMTSSRYYENAATTERDDDDYGFEKLRGAVLPILRENIKAAQYRILLRDIHIDGDRAWADYEYFYTFKYVEGGNEGWKQKNDFNRLEFVREQGRWKISGGL